MRTKSCCLTACVWMLAQPVFAATVPHDHGGESFHMFRVEMEAGNTRDDAPIQAWDVQGWVGTDNTKLWLKTEGEQKEGALESAEFWALYSRNVSTFWDAQAGVRYDTQPESTGYLTLGVNGLAPYFFETEAHLFVSQHGDATARLHVENDLLITQQLVLQPYAEVNLSAQEVPDQALGAGITDGTIGLQTRYEFTRKFAPYVDVHYGTKFGETASLAKGNGESRGETVGTLGLRLMF